MKPPEICVARLQARQAEHKRLTRLHRILGNARLAGVGAGLLAIWFVESSAPAFTWLAVFALAVAFLQTSQAFSRVESSMRYADLAAKFYSAPVLGHRRKEGPGQTVEALTIQEDHPFALDVDVLQPDGLFDRLNITSAREAMGELARLLTQPAGPQTIKERQAAVKELKPLLDLRERFFVEGARRVPFIRTAEMLRWTSQDAASLPRWIRPSLAALSALVVCGVVALALSPSPATHAFLGASLVCEMAVWLSVRNRIQVPSLEAERLHLDFSELRRLLGILEGEDFESPRLKEIRRAVRAGDSSASRTLRSFCRMIALYEARQNQFVGLFGPLVLYETQLALMVENWRVRHGSRLPDWIRAVASFEAYSSLATFSFEHPGYVFPDLVEKGPLLQASDLAHPLLDEEAVANDVSLDSDRPVLVVSGANMAGKSTFLRTIGINLALAYAGAPVRATSMTTSAPAVIASIQVADSLQRGESRFWAELRKIRTMLESVRGGTSTLVLIDELFGGTNSYDRFAGAVALAEYLLSFDSALAVLSTHDRNVTRWVEDRSGRISNAHFQDVLDDGNMTFDYKLRSGPATRANAVKLMRLAGIPVSGDRSSQRA